MLNSINDLIYKYLTPYKRSGNDEIRAKVCPFCHGGDSGDAYSFSLNVSTGNYFCFRGSCSASGGIEQLAAHFGDVYKGKIQPMNTKSSVQYALPKADLQPLTPPIIDYFNHRQISEKTLSIYGVSSDPHGNIVFPFHLNGDLIYVKYRRPAKPAKGDPKEWQESNTRPILFGMDLCDPALPLIITEGEIDALSLREAGITNAVSVPCGCDNLKWIEECWDWLEKFDVITIFGDNDPPGRKMVNQITKRLGESRCKIVEEYPLKPDKTECKDANEILCELGEMILLDVLDSAKEIPTRGLISLSKVIPSDPTSIPRIKTNIPALDQSVGGLREGAVTVFTGKAGEGKLLANQTPVLTRKGWKYHGDLVVGDEVISNTGAWVKVLHVFPKGNANVKIRFSNGEEIYCHENHEWVIVDHRGARSVIETKSMMKNHPYCLIPRSPLIGDEKPLPIAPYTLGLWLGNGNNRNPNILCSSEDSAMIDGVLAEGYVLSSVATHSATHMRYYGFKKLRFDLQKCGMCFSRESIPKRIPEIYLTASIPQRLRLLAGLLDSNGVLDRDKSRYTFSTSCVELANSFAMLVSSFGWEVSVRIVLEKLSSKAGTVRHISFVPNMTVPCLLERKRFSNPLGENRIRIENIECCDPVEGNCIMVEGGVYCVGKTMLPTHNSTLSGLLLLNAIEQGQNVCAYSGELTSEEFQQWINLQAAGSDYITTKFDPVKGSQVPVVPKDVEQAIVNWYDGHFFLYDNQEIFEANQSEAIIDVFTTAARKYGCRLFLVDNLMTALSDSDEETKAQGRFVNALKRFANRFKVHVIIVAHPRKTKAGESIRQDDIGGNSATVRLAHSAIVVEKPNIRVIKARDSGHLKLIECCYCPDSRRIYQKDSGDQNHFSWNDGSIPQPKKKACDLPEFAVQVGQPDGMF